MQILPKKSFVYNLQRLTLFLQSWHLLTPDFESRPSLCNPYIDAQDRQYMISKVNFLPEDDR